MASARATLLATIFFAVPLVILLVAVLAFDANIFAVLTALTWLGLGLVFTAASLGDA